MDDKIYERREYLETLESLVTDGKKGLLPMAVVGGRRRLGKSYVPAHFFRARTDVTYISLKFPIDANEADTITHLHNELIENLKRYHFPFPISIKSFADLFGLLEPLFRHFHSKAPLLIHFDEVQELRRFEGSEGSFVVEVDKWREGKVKYNGALLLTGSMWRHLDPMFSDHKRPLYGRETRRLVLYPWRPLTVAKLIGGTKFTQAQDFLTVYSFTGGVPWYIDLLDRSNYLKGASKNPWGIVRDLFVFGPLRNEEVQIVNTHFRGDAQALFQGLFAGKVKRTEFEEILSPGNYENFKRFIQSINENYEFVDFITDPLFPDQVGTDRIRVRDPFLYFVLALGKRLASIPPHFIESARQSVFDKAWLHHEGWCLEDIVYRLMGEHADELGWRVDYSNFGFRVNVENSAEMDILSFSAKGGWVELIETKRSLQPEYLTAAYLNKKIHALRIQLEKRFPKKKWASWEVLYRMVYAYDEARTAQSNQLPDGLDFGFEIASLSSILSQLDSFLSRPNISLHQK